MTDTDNQDRRFVEIPEEHFDETKASLSEAEDENEELRASLKEAESDKEELQASLEDVKAERDAATAQVEALNPVTDMLRAALKARGGLADDFVENMSADEVLSAIDDPEEYIVDPESAVEDSAGGGSTGSVGSPEEGTPQTANGQRPDMDTETEEKVAALSAKRDKAKQMGWDAAAEQAQETIDQLTA